jgi:hypothetical protein
MMRHALTAICLAVPVASALAQQVPIFVYGIGRSSRANWLSQPAKEAEGTAWIFGYWAGLNRFNEQNHMVGGRSDSPAIVGETKKICAIEPSTYLIDAVERVYYEFQRRGK